MDVLDAVVIISAFVFATCCGFIQVDNGWHHHSDYCSGDILQDFECSFNNCPSSHATIGFHGSDFYCSLSKVKLFFCLPGSGRLNKSSVVPLCKSNRPVKPKPARNIGSSTRWRQVVCRRVKSGVSIIIHVLWLNYADNHVDSWLAKIVSFEWCKSWCHRSMEMRLSPEIACKNQKSPHFWRAWHQLKNRTYIVYTNCHTWSVFTTTTLPSLPHNFGWESKSLQCIQFQKKTCYSSNVCFFLNTHLFSNVCFQRIFTS